LENIKYLITVLLLIVTIELDADRTSVNDPNSPSPCQTDFDPNSTLITFYGDSLGELIRLPLYGYFGWEWYLTTQEPRVRWDVQNFAVS
jgi:hypothetical protein